MILYTLGTATEPFDRAVDWLELLLMQGVITEPVLFQHGVTDATRLEHPLVSKIFGLSMPQMREAVQRSRLVIAHAGQGSTRMLAEMSARFVVLPRLARYREHIDDHQLHFAQAVARFGVHYSTELPDLTRYIQEPPPPFQGQLFAAPALVDHLLARYALS
ncbi:glycosyltransferase [Anthocerotibacter panamensis]|uniref:glycosyltransferase n=1 Tax=Anthocerotibacter panamensis TaxID=2857077 RepID=UPI001C402AD7|nr:glycosyltransferase [Anthocerotibacter panamensis]